MAKSSSKASYESYLKQFNAKKVEFEKWNLLHSDKPKKFHDEAPLSKKTFQTIYAGERNRRKEQVSQGKRKTVGNITRAIVESQAYEITQAQAKAFAEAAYQSALAENKRKHKKNRLPESKIKRPILSSEVRRDPNYAKSMIDFDRILKKYYSLKKDGYSPADARKEISARWFGS